MQYFVHSTLGCDNNDGLTPVTPWKSLEKINATTFQPGDEIVEVFGNRKRRFGGV